MAAKAASPVLRTTHTYASESMSLIETEFKDRSLVLMDSSFPVTSFCSGHWGSVYLVCSEDAGTPLGTVIQG